MQRQQQIYDAQFKKRPKLKDQLDKFVSKDAISQSVKSSKVARPNKRRLKQMENQYM